MSKSSKARKHLVEFLANGVARTFREIAQEFEVPVERVSDLLAAKPRDYNLFTPTNDRGEKLILLEAEDKKPESPNPVWVATTNHEGDPYIWVQMPERTGWKKIKIYPWSDIHFGATGHDEKGFDACTEIIAQKPHAFTILVGDVLEMAFKTSIGGSVYQQTLTPRQQIKQFREKLRPIAHKVLLAIPGNHENRLIQMADLDPLEFGICDHFNIPYFDEPVYIDIIWKGHVFSFFAQHGRSGAQTIGGKLNVAARPLLWNDFTMFTIMAHVHDPISGINLRRCREWQYDEDGKLKSFRIVNREEHVLVCASNYRYFETYASRAGYVPGAREIVIACVIEPDGKYHLEKKNLSNSR